MVKIDLVTGFLGSGKTTFIKRYAQYLIDSGMNIGILENDYGAVNVDMLLLNELRGDKCELEMVAGGCDIDCHRRRFKTKLISMGMCGYDRVIVEPSGIFDVDEFFDVLNEEPLDRWYEIGNVITVVDANLENDLTEASRYLLAAQLAKAGTVIFSKVNNADSQQLSATLDYMNGCLEQYKCEQIDMKDVVCCEWDELDKNDFDTIISTTYKKSDHVKLTVSEENDYDSLYYMNVRLDEDTLVTTIGRLMNDRECGNVFRIKGFMKVAEDKWVEINATHKEVSIKSIISGQEVVIVIGEKLNEAAVSKYWPGAGY